MLHRFCPHSNISATKRWIAMKFCTDIHDPQRMYHNDFVDPMGVLKRIGHSVGGGPLIIPINFFPDFHV